MTILIVDDDKVTRQLLRRILSPNPRYQIVEAENGPEGLRLLAQGPLPGLCILDHKMPGMNGIEVLEAIRKDRRLGQLPVIMVTSSKDVAVVTKAVRLRVNYYILKPFDPKLVRAQVAKFVVAEPVGSEPLTVPVAEPVTGAPATPEPADPKPSPAPPTDGVVPEPAAPAAVSRVEVESRLRQCTLLPSLASLNHLLRDRFTADQRYALPMGEAFSQDPSLAARVLRLANSVYAGLSEPLTSLEEAVASLGLRPVRELALAAPIIEDLQTAVGEVSFPWPEFWRHSLATALLTREIASAMQPAADEADFLAGLLHDVGRIVMAAEFPVAFAEFCRRAAEPGVEVRGLEKEVFGLEHGELGALYLERHGLPPAMIEVARFHTQPGLASAHCMLVAAVQLANGLARSNGIGQSGDSTPVSEEQWLEAEGWPILFPKQMEAERALLRADLKHCLARMPRVPEAV